MTTTDFIVMGLVLILIGVNASPKVDDGSNRIERGARGPNTALAVALFSAAWAYMGDGDQAAPRGVAALVVSCAAGFMLATSIAPESQERRRGQAETLVLIGAAFLVCGVVRAIFF